MKLSKLEEARVERDVASATLATLAKYAAERERLCDYDRERLVEAAAQWEAANEKVTAACMELASGLPGKVVVS